MLNLKVSGIKTALVISICLIIPYSAQSKSEAVVKAWFTDSCPDGGAVYAFTGRTAVTVQKDADKLRGAVLKVQFDDREYPGVETILGQGKCVDLSGNRSSGALRFFVKGLHGGESFTIGLMDIGSEGKNKVEVRVQSKNHFDITTDWTQVTLPLKAFPDDGERWFAEMKGGEYAKIDWKNINSIKFSTAKEQNFGRSENRIATVFIDDIEIVSDIKNITVPRFTQWRLLSDTVGGPVDSDLDSSKAIFSFLEKTLGNYVTACGYGDPTDCRISDTKSNTQHPVFITYFNDSEWSGITLDRAQTLPIDLKPYRQSGGLEFKVKGAFGGETFTIGLIDDESDGADKRTQSRVPGLHYVKVTREWQTVRIPFSDFGDIGRWWHSDAHYEVVGNIDWSRITSLRFSTDKFGNRSISQNGTKPVCIYFADIKLLKTIEPATNEQYWKKFKSDTADKLIDDYDNSADISKWQKTISPNSVLNISSTENTDNNSKAVKFDFQTVLFGSATYRLENSDSSKANWSKHSAVKFDFYSAEPAQTCMVMIVDSSNEAWFSNYETKKGWQQIIVPFSNFKLFPWWQPDNVTPNGKMDMEKIQSFDIRPGVKGKQTTIAIDNLILTNKAGVTVSDSKKLKVNQLGYVSDRNKEFIVADSSAKNFAILDQKGTIMYNGQLEPKGLWPISGEYLSTGDFSVVVKPGNYQIATDGTSDKETIEIKDNIYKSAFNAAVKSFYYQRLSVDLDKKYAGQWFRASGIPDTACSLHVSTGKCGTINASGGWMDAGDYGKYIVNAGITIGTLLSLYEMYPDCVSDSLNIPESNNGQSDLLDEIKFELTWMKKMQDSDGGVFFKVGSLAWDAFIMPVDLTSPRFVIGKSTTSALDFSAVMAMSARIYKDFDKEFSKDCLKRAISAWQWALANPEVREPSETGGTGSYEDSKMADEFFWAAAELFTTTGKKMFKQYLKDNAKNLPISSGAGWQNVRNLGWYTLSQHFTVNQFPLVAQGCNDIVSTADTYLQTMTSNPYHVPTADFSWGSNSAFLNKAIVMCFAYKFTQDKKYLLAVSQVTDYIFGKNGNEICFVTGFGARSPLQPHHRVMSPDGIDAPIPGFLVGGPNGERQDELAGEPNVFYPFKEPARAYTDRVGAYACNEVAINWNAPLVFVLGFLNTNMK